MNDPDRESIAGLLIEHRDSLLSRARRSGTPVGTLMARKKRAVDHIRSRLREHGFRVPSRDREGR